MRKNISLLFFVILVMSALSACAPIYVPLHMPSNMNNSKAFWDVPSEEISKRDPFADGTPQYFVRLKTGSHVSMGGQRYDDYIYAHTNADTQGLDQIADGSSKYSVSVAHYKDNSGQGYLVTNVESEKNLSKRKTEEYNKKRALLEEKQCTNIGNGAHFCYDDNSKLAGHDISAVSKSLGSITRKMVSVNKKSLGIGDPTEVGQWYLESVTENSISVTVMQKYPKKELIGDIVLDKQIKAGTLYYLERK